MNDYEVQAAHKWIASQLRNGTPVRRLHELVDSVAASQLSTALSAERMERHRADALHVERDKLQAELDALRAGLEALPT